MSNDAVAVGTTNTVTEANTTRTAGLLSRPETAGTGGGGRSPIRRMGALVALGVVALTAAGAANLFTSSWYHERQLRGMSLTELGRASVRTPADYRVQYYLGKKLAELGVGDDALMAFGTALRIHPEDPRVWRAMADLLFQRKDFTTAASLLPSALERWPKDADFHAKLAAARFELGLFTGAATEEREAVSLLPPGRVTARDWTLLGRYQFESHDFVGAAESCRQAIKLRADQVDAQRGLGASLLLHGDPAAAVAPLETACRQYPSDGQAHYFLGRALLGRAAAGDRPTAIAELKRALELSPHNSRAYFWLGLAETRDGNMREAVQALDQSARLDPYYPEVYAAQAEAKRRVGDAAGSAAATAAFERLKRTYREIAGAEARSAKDANNADLAVTLGHLYRMAGRRADALRSYQRALAIRPSDPAARKAVGELSALHRAEIVQKR